MGRQALIVHVIWEDGALISSSWCVAEVSTESGKVRMEKFLLVLLIQFAAALVDEAPHYVSCDGFPEGFKEAGCWGKVVCVNHEPVVTRCHEGTMYDYASDKCIPVSPGASTTACNSPVDCTDLHDGRHADLSDECRSYFICYLGSFYGRMYCPRNTYFNEPLQICDYYGHIQSPCGSYTGVYPNEITPAGPWSEVTVVG